MRFLLGCTEVCGLIKTYSEQLKNKGHEVINVSGNHPFYDYKYTYSNPTIAYDFFTKGGKPNFFTKIFFRISELIEKGFPDFRKLLVLFLLLRKFDVHIYIWSGFVNEKLLFRFLKFFKKKVIVLFLGDDVRHFSAFSQEYDISFWQFPKEYSEKPVYHGLLRLRTAEKYADLIYSVPDQMGLAIKPYHHLQVPIQIEKFNFKNNLRTIPKILHLPSEPFIKGTDKIMSTLKELKEEGLQFEVIYKSKIPFTEVKQLLEDVDILVDEIICHGPGVLAFEAMASGCAVATNHLRAYKNVFNPPVCAIDHKNIKEKLRTLITDFDYRQKLIIEGKEFVTLNNNVEKIVNDILENLNAEQKKPNYHPTYYKEKYKMADKDRSIFKKLDSL